VVEAPVQLRCRVAREEDHSSRALLPLKATRPVYWNDGEVAGRKAGGEAAPPQRRRRGRRVSKATLKDGAIIGYFPSFRLFELGFVF
jgi:hypothetical protein